MNKLSIIIYVNKWYYFYFLIIFWILNKQFKLEPKKLRI